MDIDTNAAEQQYRYISEVEVIDIDDMDQSCQMTVEAGGIGLIIPLEMHEVLVTWCTQQSKLPIL